MRRRLVTVLALAGAVAAGCSPGPSADSSAIERDLELDLQEASGDRRVQVRCPTFRVRRGEQFRCEAMDRYGDTYLVYGIIEDDSGGFRYEVQ